MSFRALRKAQREKEEQERLKQLEEEAEELEEQDDLRSAPTKTSAFALLDDGDQENEDEDEDEHGEPNGESTATPASQSIPKVTNKKKKKKKKKARGNAEPGGVGDQGKEAEEMDEIDAALKQLATNGRSTPNSATNAGIDEVGNETDRLLAIETTHLHAQNEMRRLFGRAALENDDEDEAPAAAAGGNRRQQRRAQQVGLAQALRGQRPEGRSGLSATALRRNIFIQGKEEWPMATTGGLGMEVEEKRADGTVLYRFVRNTAYKDVQSQFEACVHSMDPNRMIVLLQHNPYHISTLLQVSEIAKSERDHATSGDLLERALFSFGRAVHSTFSKHLADGKARLDFRRAENREFWLASWRYMQNLTMRATWRTVYEWAKLLISLSPHDDPYALWLVLDQYALRARQDLDYLNLSRNQRLAVTHQNMPNVQLSQALAECRAGNKGKGRQALFTAIGKFPWIIARLLQELGLDAPPGVWGSEARTEREKLHAELYVTRAKDLWNTPENSNLLLEVASALPEKTPAAAIDAWDIAQNEARHVLLSDTPSLIALVPRKYTSQMTSASDPLPPTDAFDAGYTSDGTASRQQTATMAHDAGPRLVAAYQELNRIRGESATGRLDIRDPVHGQDAARVWNDIRRLLPSGLNTPDRQIPDEFVNAWLNQIIEDESFRELAERSGAGSGVAAAAEDESGEPDSRHARVEDAADDDDA